MARIGIIRSECLRCLAQIVTCLDILVHCAGTLPSLMEPQTIDDRVGGRGARGGSVWMQCLKTKTDGERERLRDNKCGAGLEIQTRTISISARGRKCGPIILLAERIE